LITPFPQSLLPEFEVEAAGEAASDPEVETEGGRTDDGATTTLEAAAATLEGGTTTLEAGIEPLTERDCRDVVIEIETVIVGEMEIVGEIEVESVIEFVLLADCPFTMVSPTSKIVKKKKSFIFLRV